MKILLVARDPSPSRAFRKVATCALKLSHDVHAVLGDGQDIELTSNELDAAIEWADVLLVGMSSSEQFSALERRCCEHAVRQALPFGLFSDSFECWRRQHFASVRESARYLFVSSEAEVPEAQKLYPHATVAASGNPIWEDLVIPYSRDQARGSLNVGHMMLIVCPGNKAEASDPPNKNVQLVRAVSSAYAGLDVHVVFHPHPGDHADDSYYREHLAGVADVVLRNDKDAKAQWVRAANAVVSACSPSTDLQALIHGIPCVNVLDDEVCARLRREFDADVPPMVAYGYVIQAEMGDPDSIRRALELAHERMEQGGMALPEIAQGAAAKKFVDTLVAGV